MHKVVALSFTPYPLFQLYLQSKEILLNLNMKCLNLAFNAQGLRVIMVVVQVGAVRIYAAIVRRSGKRKEGMKLSLPPNLVEKSSSGPSFFVL
jgi:hypothetical protein